MHIELIENAQKRSTKLIPSSKNLSYEDKLQSLELLSIQFHRLSYRGWNCFQFNFID